MGSTTPIVNGVQYYWIEDTQANRALLATYTGNNGLASDFKYTFEGAPGRIYAVCVDLQDDELDFLLEAGVCNYEWFRYSNQPTLTMDS